MPSLVPTLKVRKNQRCMIPNCRCAKTTAAWLFGSDLRVTQSEWTQLADPKGDRHMQQFKHFEQSLQQHNVLPVKLKQLLHTRLFGLTRRALYADLQLLDRHPLAQTQRPQILSRSGVAKKLT